MKRTMLLKVAGVSAVLLGLGGCSGMGSMGSTSSLYQQLGGMDSINKMASSLVNSSKSDPRLASAMGNVNSSTASSKVADQLCAALGGGCSAPYSDSQMQAAADRLTPDQRTAVSDNFTTALNSVTSNPLLRDSVSKAIGSKMSGILGAVR
jgi:truncated hemoglobin YjbI